MAGRMWDRTRVRKSALAALIMLLCATGAEVAAVRAAENGGPGRDVRGASSGLPGWKQADDWDVTYSISAGEESSSPNKNGTLRVRYKRPNQVRIDVTGSKPYSAVADSDSVCIYMPLSRLSVLAPLGEHSPFEIALLPDDFLIGPLPGELKGQGPQMAPADTIASARRGERGLRLLSEEVVAGRPALVMETTAPSPSLRRVSWVDKEYGIPLAGRVESEGPFQAEFRAQEVRINQGIGPAVFALDMPASTVTFKGRLGIEDADRIRDMLGEDLLPRQERIPWGLDILPDKPGLAQHILILPRLPTGFRSNGSGAFADDDGWGSTATYVKHAGAVILFTEQTGIASQPLMEMTTELRRSAEVTQVKVNNRPATLYRHQKPYPGLILAWRAQGVQAMLEATDVPADELLDMAGSAIALKLTRQKEVILPDFATAASLLSMPIYRPTYLPRGAKLVRLTGDRKAGEWGPETLRMTATYALPRGMSLSIRQSQVSEFERPNDAPGGEHVKVPGGTASYIATPSLTWLPKGSHTKVVISGRVSKAVMLKIARSLKAVGEPGR